MRLHGPTDTRLVNSKTVFLNIETLETLLTLEKVRVEPFGHMFTYREMTLQFHEEEKSTTTRRVFLNSSTLKVEAEFVYEGDDIRLGIDRSMMIMKCGDQLEIYSYETPILNLTKTIDKYVDIHFGW